jgi:transcriptional regulator with XRE-family HTH domain
VSKEPPATCTSTCERSEYVFRLNVAKLREAAKGVGDITGYKIHIRTGISESSVYRYLNGEAQPDLNSAMRLVEAYDLDIRRLMERVPIKAAA